MVFWGGCEGNRRPLVREIGRESEKDQNRQRGEIRPEQQGFGGRIERAEWRDAERWGGGGRWCEAEATARLEQRHEAE